MKVHVRVFGSLVPVIGKEHDVELEDDATVNNLTYKLARQSGQSRSGYFGNYRVGGGDLAILINGKNIALMEGLKTVLSEGDDVVILPPTVGG